MNLSLHTQAGQTVAEFYADEWIIQKEEDAIRLMEELHASGALKVILHQENIAPAFFDLSTGLAGAVLQKFVTYSIPVAIVGDFSSITSKSLKAFIYESNRGHQVFFLDNLEEALERLARL